MAQVSEKAYWLSALVIAVAACATGTRPPSGDLTGVEWRLTEIDGAAAVTSATGGGRDASLRLDADGARVIADVFGRPPLSGCHAPCGTAK